MCHIRNGWVRYCWLTVRYLSPKGAIWALGAVVSHMLHHALRLAALLLALVSLTACGETHRWHQKTILEVETPNGLVSGGSVVEASVSWFGGIDKAMSSSAVSNGLRGEASFVEVAQGKYLFALLYTEEAARTTALFTDNPREEARHVTERLQTLKETRTLKPEKYPMLVTFTDVSNPKTVKLVDPENLAAAFGPGFALKSVKLELTDEKLTEGAVGHVLDWVQSPSILKNPVWATLPSLLQETIMGLKVPVGVKP